MKDDAERNCFILECQMISRSIMSHHGMLLYAAIRTLRRCKLRHCMSIVSLRNADIDRTAVSPVITVHPGACKITARCSCEARQSICYGVLSAPKRLNMSTVRLFTHHLLAHRCLFLHHRYISGKIPTSSSTHH